MHLLATLMQDDAYTLLAQQILLYLHLTEMLECKYVCKLWWTHMKRLLNRERTQWSNVHLAKKMAAAVASVEGGTVVQEIHLNEYYRKLTKKDYFLSSCELHGGLIVLMFKRSQDSSSKKKYWICALSQRSVNQVMYLKKLDCDYGDYYWESNTSMVIWWYTIGGNANVHLTFAVISLPSFSEKLYKKTFHSNRFISPTVTLHEVRSGNSSLRSSIKKQFPGMDYHKQINAPRSLNVAVYCANTADVFYYTIFYYTIKSTQLWVVESRSKKVAFKPSSCKRDWTCNNGYLPYIQLKHYSHAKATFYIETSRSFAVWDLSQPGHPRHIGFDVQLPTEPWNKVYICFSRSKWIIGIHDAKASHYIFIDLPSSKRTLKNSTVNCKCRVIGTRNCVLEETRLTMEATRISHTPWLLLYDILDRFMIVGTLPWSPKPYVHVLDCWKPKDETKRCSAGKAIGSAMLLLCGSFLLVWSAIN